MYTVDGQQFHQYQQANKNKKKKRKKEKEKPSFWSRDDVFQIMF